MSEQPPPYPGPTPHAQPPPGTARPGELLDRFLARLIDGVGLGVVYGILYSIFLAAFVSGYRTVGEALVFAIVLNVVFTAVYIGYYAYFESSRGATLGKQLMKLTVVGPGGGGPPTMEQALRRNAFQAISLIAIVPVVGTFLGPLASLAAVIMIAVTINNDPVNRQGWHDTFAGGTRVLKVG